MSGPERGNESPIRRLAIPATCTVHGGTPGYANLVLRKLDGQIEIDPHVDHCCLLVLDEDAACQVRDALTEWLG